MLVERLQKSRSSTPEMIVFSFHVGGRNLRLKPRPRARSDRSSRRGSSSIAHRLSQRPAAVCDRQWSAVVAVGFQLRARLPARRRRRRRRRLTATSVRKSGRGGSSSIAHRPRQQQAAGSGSCLPAAAAGCRRWQRSVAGGGHSRRPAPPGGGGGRWPAAASVGSGRRPPPRDRQWSTAVTSLAQPGS